LFASFCLGLFGPIRNSTAGGGFFIDPPARLHKILIQEPLVSCQRDTAFEILGAHANGTEAFEVVKRCGGDVEICFFMLSILVELLVALFA